jgi:hypothetical protein
MFLNNKNLKFKPAFCQSKKGAPISKDVSANFLIQKRWF